MERLTEERTAAEVLCDVLVAEGVELLFGHPGGAILPFYDALHRVGRPYHVLVRHEQAAAHAADGYARATGRVGVCIATSGPGATNLLTGLATAMMDSVPIVAITGQVSTQVLGQDAFQETDVLGVTMPVTKHGFLIREPHELPAIVREAFRLARSGRPGPVVVDIPKDVQNAGSAVSTPAVPAVVGAANWLPACGAHQAVWRLASEEVAHGAGCNHAPRQAEQDATLHRPASRVRAARQAESPHAPCGAGACAEDIEDAVALLATAERPLIMAGRGVVLAGMPPALLALAEQSDLPVVTTLLGLDGFPAAHPLALGLPGMHGTERANHAIQRADVILGLGLRFDDRVTGPTARFAPYAKIIHADIDPVSIGRTIRPAVELLGDLRHTLPLLCRRVRAMRRTEWRTELEQWSRQAAPDDPWTGAARPLPDAVPRPLTGALPNTGPSAHLPAGPPPGALTGRVAARALAQRIAASGALVATDVGQHQMWLAQELGTAAPRTHFTSGGLGTMGYALPAALGATLGRPDRPMWVVAGDGGFQMTSQELATVVQERLPLRIAVFNNGFLGMVRQWQQLFYERRYSASELTGPDFALLAWAFGIPARTIARAERLNEALDWAEASRGAVLLDLRLAREENVYPMVPAGAAIDELIMGDPAEAVA